MLYAIRSDLVQTKLCAETCRATCLVLPRVALYAVGFALCTTRCALKTENCALCAYCDLYTVYGTHSSVYCVLYTVFCKFVASSG